MINKLVEETDERGQDQSVHIALSRGISDVYLVRNVKEHTDIHVPWRAV